MSLIFIGRVGVEKYAEGDKYLERPSQQFKSGRMRFSEQFKGKQTVFEDVLGNDGKPQMDDKGGKIVKSKEVEAMIEKEYTLSPKDIGKKFDFNDEAQILKKYPVSFKKA